MHHVCSGSFYDTVVFGAGYAGVAAAVASQRAGRRTLLIDRHGSVLAESGWAFARATGVSTEPLWVEWRARIERRTDRADGAIAEVLGVDLLAAESIELLFYSAPVASTVDDDGRLASVTFASKGGLRRLGARQWIDATDTGELAGLLAPSWQPPQPEAQEIHLYFRQPAQVDWPTIDWNDANGASLTWTASSWPNERVLSIRRCGTFSRPRAQWIPALGALHGLAACDLRGSVLTHGSIEPFSVFPDLEVESHRELPANVCFCGARGSTLAEKFVAGCRAARLLPELPSAAAFDPAGEDATCIRDTQLLRADVGIAGLGTGGAIAAIAAARQGAKVVAFDALPFPGGVGTGAGIHFYYFGMKGGLQEEVDTRVREIMPFFGSAAQVGGFHPEAKKIVLDDLLAAAGVVTTYAATLYRARQLDGVVDSVDVATPRGSCSVRATAWVDATGDGDLAARAGAGFRLGREGDGLLHAYSQSCGRARCAGDTAKLDIINTDTGFCDPTDERDLTRARLVGMLQYVQDRYDDEARPTYIAPALGLRQSRHIVTDYTLTLDDLIERRRFQDVVGYTGCHYDNHARDYEFESDEAAFWVWVCQQWYGRLACEIPFRILLARDLKNVLVGCRASGVSEEAHHSFRVQRDMQRIGEVAGIAASLASNVGGAVRGIQIADLQQTLVKSGALTLQDLPDRSFGHHAAPDYFEVTQGKLESWLAELAGGPATDALWHLYRAEACARPRVEALLHETDRTITWRAAALLAMWCDERAEPRLLEAIRSREDDRNRDITKPQQEWFYMPRWYAALTLLKRCITPRSLDLLETLAAHPQTELNVRCAVALAYESLAARAPHLGGDLRRIERSLEALLATPAPHGIRSPQGSPLGQVEPPPIPQPTDLRPVLEDFTWQLHLAVLRARLALDLPPHPRAWVFTSDERAIVRRRFSKLLESDRPSTADV